MSIKAIKFSFGLIIGLLFVYTLEAQIPKSVEIEVSDPRATGILEAAKVKSEQWSTVKVEFTVQINLPDQQPELQRGTLIQKQNQYRLDLPDRLIICDGENLWSYLKEANEIQIQDVETGDDDFQTPLDWLRIYDSPDYYYALTDQVMENGQNLSLIEFKPRQLSGDLSKVRLTMKPSNIPQQLDFFYRDGVQMIIKLHQFHPNQVVSGTSFLFNKADYPGVHIEDLRF